MGDGEKYCKKYCLAQQKKFQDNVEINLNITPGILPVERLIHFEFPVTVKF